VEAQPYAFLTSALDGGESLPLIDIIDCSPETKPMQASVQGVGVDF
jgi:hypothetical protein